MPNIQSAKKKMRKDILRTKRNNVYRNKIKKITKTAVKKKNSSDKNFLKEAFSVIDKAAREKIIHKNKAARLKSRISKLIKKIA